MSEDITFCFYSKCPNRKCERHMSRIKIPYIPHSYAFFKDCKWWNIPDVVLDEQCISDLMRDALALIGVLEQNGKE